MEISIFILNSSAFFYEIFTSFNRTLFLSIKGLVTVKVKPNVALFTSCSQLLKSLNADEFKKSILPALQRAMLRSPEVILQGVGAIIHEINIDCSDFAFDLGKTLITNLYSKDDSARVEAVETLKEISIKCSDTKAIEALVKQVFAVLNGCDGKITVAEFRINILQVCHVYILFLCSFFFNKNDYFYS